MFNSVLLQVVNNAAGVVAQTADTAKNAAMQTAQMPVAPTPPKEVSLSLMELIMNGGPIMIPLGILSILTIYFFFERLLTVNKASKMEIIFTIRYVRLRL